MQCEDYMHWKYDQAKIRHHVHSTKRTPEAGLNMVSDSFFGLGF